MRSRPQPREARFSEVEAILDTAQFFYEKTHKHMPDRQGMLDIIVHCLHQGAVVVNKTDGKITALGIATLFPNTLSLKMEAREVMWYAADGSGSALLDTMEDLCRKRGATKFYMTVIEEARPSAHALVKRKGYEAVERSYIKEL